MPFFNNRSNKAKARFCLLFIIFWGVIIFYVSKRDKALDINLDDNFIAPVIRPQYRNKGGVPKVFHQLWKSKDIPEKWQPAFEACEELNSDYQHIVWTDRMLYNFIAKEYAWFYEIFMGYPYHIQRVDVARYFILYHYGGVYLDIDAFCKASFKKIVANMTEKHSVLLPMTDIYGVTNSFMVAKPNSNFFKYVIQELPKYAHGVFSLVRHTTIIFSTGPTFMSHCVYTYDSQKDLYVISIHDYEHKYFYHAKDGSWHRMDTEIVDAFHFHYIKLFIIFITIIILMYLRKRRHIFASLSLKTTRVQGYVYNNLPKLKEDTI